MTEWKKNGGKSHSKKAQDGGHGTVKWGAWWVEHKKSCRHQVVVSFELLQIWRHNTDYVISGGWDYE